MSKKTSVSCNPAMASRCFFRLEAVKFGAESPSMTLYRKSIRSVSQWISQAAKRAFYDQFILMDGAGHVMEIYDSQGEPTEQRKSGGAPKPEASTGAVEILRDEFTDEARLFSGDASLSLVTCVDDHAGASAADHSNFAVMFRRMIEDASPADLDHVCIVESRRWPCPVTGIFANVANLSPAMQDIFLDRIKWIQNSWPMVSNAHREILAERLAKYRTDYVHELLRNCARAARWSEERTLAMSAKWILASPAPKLRLARHLVDTLQEGLRFERNAAETFDPQVVKKRGRLVIKDYKRRMALPEHGIPSFPDEPLS